MLEFGPDICNDLHEALSREWLVTNGIGGYASGTLAGPRTRRYHGLLVAATTPPTERTLLVAKLDETAIHEGHQYPLSANQWQNGRTEPRGFEHLRQFHLEGTTPVWTYAFGSALLEKRVWMEHGENTTYVHYCLRSASTPMTVNIAALVSCRDHHDITSRTNWPTPPCIEQVQQGLKVTACPDTPPYYLLSDGAQPSPVCEWKQGFFLGAENYRGLEAGEDLFHAGNLRANLLPAASLMLVLTTQAPAALDCVSPYERHREREYDLLATSGLPDEPREIQQLVLAADQFMVQRSLPRDQDGCSVVAGYPWFTDWGRDTMISLPGLALTTKQHDVAAKILRTFSHYVDQGMLPNCFPDVASEPEYNTVDATLWYFEAIRAYYEAAGDADLVRDLFPVLHGIVGWHLKGTRYGIHLDSRDGLLYAGREGMQLTWMDAKIDGRVVTPRIGKPVELNALWYHAMRIMAEFARLLKQSPHRYENLAERAAASFARFWNASDGYCYDVIDGPAGHDPSLRPNQLLAVSLLNSPLSYVQQRAVVDVCTRHLLTPHGMRSLGPGETGYIGTYGGSQRERDAAYHQGTTWGWLIGPFVRAHLRVYHDPDRARSFLRPLVEQLSSHGLGSLSEIFDGDPPFRPRGCIAQAWTVAEVLSAWQAASDCP
jgi:predicted glycogen debranching enzyme